MSRAADTEVLVVGAGPVGLSAALELRRHGVRCRIVDRLAARLPYAKAIGIQPRTLELWDRAGLARTVMEAALTLRGQLVYVDGEERVRAGFDLPPDVPYRFAALPQYATEAILEAHLAGLGTPVERGTDLLSFTQDPDGVTARLRSAAGAEEELRVRYLAGCDGAHSTVRKGLGLDFGGGAFPQEYMLGDLLLDWDLPPAYAVRATRPARNGAPEEVLVCVPLPGAARYRVSMAVPPGLTVAPSGEGTGPTSGGGTATEGPAHGLDPSRAPTLDELRAVVDRLAPRPAELSGLRWSSVFRISHRIADRYGEGRVFVAGDAAHIHPPTGAQGMNTGIQDACNLAWKLALVVRGTAGPELLASYDAERRPVGEEVVGRTVRHARAGGVGAGPDTPDPRTLALTEGQLLVSYRSGPLDPGGEVPDGAPGPGDRAPDCPGLTAALAAYPLRLLDLLRDRPGHVLLLYAPDPTAAAAALAAAAGAGIQLGGDGAEPGRPPRTGLPAEAVTILAADPAAHPPQGPPGAPPLVSYRDAAGEFARLYRPAGPTGFLVRPDGALAARFPLDRTAEGLGRYLTALSVRPGAGEGRAAA
ncbi:FAD-dependent monooxygenase [Streptomyces sp. NPDC097619]|uniref:FAD-dependent monooxygenase n=1 Tax=Streptomyces sp. NPDC097619 TaxID=3157228 RepID=UPI0033244FD0